MLFLKYVRNRTFVEYTSINLDAGCEIFFSSYALTQLKGISQFYASCTFLSLHIDLRIDTPAIFPTFRNFQDFPRLPLNITERGHTPFCVSIGVAKVGVHTSFYSAGGESVIGGGASLSFVLNVNGLLLFPSIYAGMPLPSRRFTTCVSLWASNAALRNVYVHTYHRATRSIFLSLSLSSVWHNVLYSAAVRDPFAALLCLFLLRPFLLGFPSSQFFEPLLGSSWHS